MSRILPLPPDAVSQIQSSRNITSVQGVALALLENSLDSGASKIEINIDFSRGDCTVEDNGAGISPLEFAEDGGLCKLYHTSKQNESNNNEMHGSTGTYLASLAALSFLTVTSKHRDHPQLTALSLHQGNVVARNDPAPQSHFLTISTRHGTQVQVRDLFGNFPVRVKLRASLADSILEETTAWNELRAGIVALLVAWPKPCAVRIRSVQDNGKTLHLTGFHPSVSNALTRKHLKHIDGGPVTFTLEDALPILFQSSVAPRESQNQWVPVSASTSRLSLKGIICLSPAPTKSCQFLSIGVHPCSPSSGHNALYDAVNKMFSHSSFGVVDDDDDSGTDEAEKDRRKRDRRFKNDGCTRKQLHTRKGIDKWPMFILQVEFKDHRQHLKVVEKAQEGSMNAVVDVLEATTTQWLATHHFRPRQLRRTARNSRPRPAATSVSSAQGMNERYDPSDPTSPSKRAATTEGSMPVKAAKAVDGRPHLSGQVASARTHSAPTPRMDFSAWSRIKSSRSSFYDKVWPGHEAGELAASTAEDPVERSASSFEVPVVQMGELSHRDVAIAPEKRPLDPSQSTVESSALEESGEGIHGGDVSCGAECAPQHTECDPLVGTQPPLKLPHSDHETTDDRVVDWIDPVTKQTFKVNARTGVVLPDRATGNLSSNAAAINTSKSSAGKALTLSRRGPPAKEDHNNTKRRLPGFLQEWNNPVFARPNEEPIPSACNEITTGEESAWGLLGCKGAPPAFQGSTNTVPAKLSKAMLKTAEVIKQVDRKFILCKSMPEAGGENKALLFLVDQHAASERVILEGLLDDLCSPNDSIEATDDTSLDALVKSVRLSRPVTFEVTASERELFETHVRHFAEWGIRYAVSLSNTELASPTAAEVQNQCSLTVNALPPSIAERCTASPHLLIDLLRSEIWAPNKANPRPQIAADGIRLREAGGWVARIASCPKGVIDILNSRACRSAVMFNDELSNDECERLLRDLSRCCFPFICAHGRVSMVPIIELPGSEYEVFG